MNDYLICNICYEPLGDSCIAIPINPGTIISSEVYCCSGCIDDQIKQFPERYSQIKLTRKFLNKNTNQWE